MTSKFNAMFGGVKAETAPEKIPAAPLGALNDDVEKGAHAMEHRTVLGIGCSVEGKLVCRGAARIDGDVDGEISADEILIVGKDATISADLDVPELHVSGAVRGNIVAVKRVILAPTAHIQGDIRTPSLTIQEGAQILGKVEVGPIGGRDAVAPAIADLSSS